jgi:hypothetical protein
MEQYHGTNTLTANNIVVGLIDVSVGGGELGRGFYSGDLKHEAFNWAWHKYRSDKAVVQLTLDDDQFLALNKLCLDFRETYMCRQEIRNTGQTRIFLFFVDVVWAPVVGKLTLNFNQFKYESIIAENYLNSVNVMKQIL